MNWKIGMTQWQLPVPMADCVRATAELGLEAVQVDLGPAAKGYPLTDPALQARLLEDAARTGVALVSLVLNDLCGNGFVRAPGDPRRDIAYETLRRGVETAARMGVPTICMPSFFDNRISDADSYARTVEAIRYICDLGAEKGITIYTENVMDPAALLRFFDDMDRPALRLLFDSQNYRQMVNGDAAAVFEAARDRVGDFLHIKDGVKGLGDAPLGEGNSDLRRTLKIIVSCGFRGTFILENKYGTLEEARNEAAVLRTMLDEAAGA